MVNSELTISAMLTSPNDPLNAISIGGSSNGICVFLLDIVLSHQTQQTTHSPSDVTVL